MAKSNKTLNPGANESWRKRKREINASDKGAQISQRLYRLNALRQRQAEDRLTEKNKAELQRVGG